MYIDSTSALSFCRVMMKSIICECFHVGCTHVNLLPCAVLHRVLVMTRLFSVQNEGSFAPFEMIFPIPDLPRVSLHAVLLIAPTCVLKSASMRSLLDPGCLVDQVLKLVGELVRFFFEAAHRCSSMIRGRFFFAVK